uniref:MFS domain-containing protein n=1 Tax=Heterorhabditis bacteriophora TaxID=37862 RepID=A0A1I7WIB0_HETBA
MSARGGKVEVDRNAETVERDLEDVGIIKPLDGGYGWFVVFASFLANLVVDGIIFTAGDALLSLWKKDFNTSDTASALTISILSGSYLLVGPIASALANLYGCRTVVIAGTFLAFFGFICSTIAPEIFFLYISFGLVGGYLLSNRFCIRLFLNIYIIMKNYCCHNHMISNYKQ